MERQSNQILTPLVKSKQALRQHLPNAVVNLYDRWKYNSFNITRTYKYNLSTLVEHKPKDITENLLLMPITLLVLAYFLNL